MNSSDNKTVGSSIKLYPAVAYSCTSIYCVTIVGGLLTNFTILLTIYRDKEFWRQSYYWVASRAIADILLSALAPLYIVHLITGQQTVPEAVCHIEAYGGYLFLCSSDLSIAFTAFCRYIQVVHYQRLGTFKKPWFLTICLLYAWVVPILTLIPVFKWHSEGVSYKPEAVACRLNESYNNTVLKWNMAFITIPIISSVTYFYIHIYIEFLRSRHRVESHRMENLRNIPQIQSVTSSQSQLSSGKRFNAALFSINIRHATNNWVESRAGTSNTSTASVPRPKLGKHEKQLTLSIFVNSITYLMMWAVTGGLLIVAQSHPGRGQLEMVGILVLRMGPLINAGITFYMNSRLRDSTLKMVRLR